jgi:hypothetical protein
MGFLDRFRAKPPAAPVQREEPVNPAPVSSSPAPVKPRLLAARERLEAKDLPGALVIYEELLATAGDRADVLVAVSGDLGAHGHVAEIIELVAPRYDAERHGPATGLNLLQAYLAVRDADAAQHVLDVLFGLNRPELEERLHGFSNALAELMTQPATAGGPIDAPAMADAPKVGLVTIAKPVWFYGLEPMAAEILPPKEGRLRRIAFAQLALPGYPDIAAAIEKPEDDLARLSRALPLWLAETFYFSASYAPIAAVALLTPPGGANRFMIFGAEWTTDNLRQLVDTSDGLDYVVTGALRVTAGDYEIILRITEVKTFRERKTFTARWTPATADQELARVHGDVKRYMEWSPASAAVAYTPPAIPSQWLETLGASLSLFAVDKAVLAADRLRPAAEDLARIAEHAAESEIASLTYLTARARAVKLGVTAPNPNLARSAVVTRAAQLLA